MTVLILKAQFISNIIKLYKFTTDQEHIFHFCEHHKKSMLQVRVRKKVKGRKKKMEWRFIIYE